MHVIDNEQVIGCDIDGTLICMSGEFPQDDLDAIDMIDPFTGQNMQIKPRPKTIELVRRMFKRGKFVIFWSQQGPMWAKAVVTALKLKHKNALIISKPNAHIDDLPCTEWMGNRIFLKEENE